MNEELSRLLRQDLQQREANHLLRQRQVIKPIDSTHVVIDGKPFVNFSSNDYLGLTHHPKVLKAIARSARSSAGSGAAGLITGYTSLHRDAEDAIVRWKGTEASILLPSGYQANLAAVQTLASVAQARGRAVRFLIDRLVHASLIDAVRATGAEFRVFPHNGISKLKRLLTIREGEAPAEPASPTGAETARQEPRPPMDVVITESIFSMDGDAADLAALARLKAEHHFVLLLDEAHGSGVYENGGAGYANECGLSSVADLSIVTLSKAMGLAGGAICGSKLLIDGVLNHARAYIYSTSIAPAICAAIPAAIEVMREEPQRQARVRSLARRVRGALSISWTPTDSPIIPIVLGDEARALEASARLRELGMLVIAVRPPTVPRGSSRLRVTLSCDHSDQEVDRLIEALKRA
jgi:7-keto-8-aminopelargonate synthetase-like enzyme